MNTRQRQLLNSLRSIRESVVDAIDALKNGDEDEVSELLDDIDYDLEQAQDLVEPVATLAQFGPVLEK